MADQEQAVDTDYSGRPYRRRSVAEILEHLPPAQYDLQVILPNGRRVADVGVGISRFYHIRDDGRPDLDRPVWIEGLSTGEPSPEAEVIEIPRPDADRT